MLVQIIDLGKEQVSQAAQIEANDKRLDILSGKILPLLEKAE